MFLALATSVKMAFAFPAKENVEKRKFSFPDHCFCFQSEQHFNIKDTFKRAFAGFAHGATAIEKQPLPASGVKSQEVISNDGEDSIIEHSMSGFQIIFNTFYIAD